LAASTGASTAVDEEDASLNISEGRDD